MLFLCALGGEDAPAAAPPTVQLAGGGVAALTETKGGATAHTGRAAGTGGNRADYFYTALNHTFTFKMPSKEDSNLYIFNLPFSLFKVQNHLKTKCVTHEASD